jgi:Ion channel
MSNGQGNISTASLTDTTHLLTGTMETTSGASASYQELAPSPLHPLDQEGRRSLTAEYRGFEQSTRAVTILLRHVLVYYTLAVVGYSYVVASWSIVDSLYFATTLCTTIGFGDIAPAELHGRFFTMCLAFYGIVILGILLGIIGESLVNLHSQSVQEQRNKAGAQVLHYLKDENRVPSEAANSLHERHEARERTLWEDVLSLAVSEAPILFFLGMVGIAVGLVEGWSIMDSLYWLVISGTTVGLGDFHPNHTWVKLFCVAFLPFAVAVFGQLLGRIASIYMDRKRRSVEKEFLSQALTLCDLSTMDTDKNGLVDRAEFLSYMLVALQKVSKDDVSDIMDLFSQLDVDGTNYLNKDDLLARDWDSSVRSSMSRASH